VGAAEGADPRGDVAFHAQAARDYDVKIADFVHSAGGYRAGHMAQREYGAEEWQADLAAVRMAGELNGYRQTLRDAQRIRQMAQQDGGVGLAKLAQHIFKSRLVRIVLKTQPCDTDASGGKFYLPVIPIQIFKPGC